MSWYEWAAVALAILVGLWLVRHLIHLVASWLHCVGSLVLGLLGLVILYYAYQYVVRALGR